MKKLCSILLSMTLLFSLAACGSGEPASSESGPSEASASSSEASSQADAKSAEMSAGSEDEPAESEAPTAEGGTLIAYFSWSGNTEQMAQAIQAEIGGDLFKIEPVTPYTDDYNTLLDVARQEQADHARPELAAQVENWDSYDVIFVGYPKMEQGYICV